MRRHQTPVLITGAPLSPAEEFAARRRRYSLIMSLRIPCLVLAGVVGLAFGWMIPAAILVIASIPLPWIAVLVANDRPVRKAEPVARFRSDRRLATPAPRALGTARVIDIAPVVDADPDVPADRVA